MSTEQHTSVAELKAWIRDFVEEREWQPFHDPKNLAMSIAIEAAELMEHFQWLRSEQLAAARQDSRTMSEVREELADILCYVLSFANALEIDLVEALRDKMGKNRRKYPAEKFKGRYKAE